MKSPILYIFCGLPFSGKSTVAKELATRLGTEYIGFDLTWQELFNSIPEEGNGWRYVRDHCKDRIRTLLQEGRSVVYDDTNVSTDHREELHSLAQESGGESKVIYVNTPREIITERMRENLATQARHDAPAEHLQAVTDQFQEPHAPEDFVEYRLGQTMDEFISMF